MTRRIFSPYGLCPKCGAYGVQRERRPNGNDQCENGCTYPSRDAIPQPREPDPMFAYTKPGGLFPAYINLASKPEGGYTLILRGDPKIEGNMTTCGQTAQMDASVEELRALRDHLNRVL